MTVCEKKYFSKAIRSCLFYELIDYLMPSNHSFIDKCKDLLNFLTCYQNRNITTFMYNELLKVVRINFSSLNVLNHNKHSLVHHIYYDIPKKLQIGDLPLNVESIIFHPDFKHPLTKDMFSSKLTHIRFGYNFNNILEVGSLPENLKKLEFGCMYNQPLTKYLPSNLTILKFNGRFNQFNQPLSRGDLPKSLTFLEFGYRFNQPLVQGDLPLGLSHLIFGGQFNQIIKHGVLPFDLLQLEFGYDFFFDQSFAQTGLPSNLTHLTFWLNRGQSFDIKILSLPASQVKILYR